MWARAAGAGVLALGTGLLGSPVSAQTIRPIVSEYQSKAQGRFELVNDSDHPFNVVMQARGFTVDASGEMHDAPLTASGQRTDTLGLNINLSGYVLPADTYTGTLRIRAQATP